MVGGGGVPGVGVGVDDPLGGLVGLAQEEPVPPGQGESGVGPGQRLADRNAIEDDEALHGIGVVQRETVRHAGAAVVPDHREPVVAELAHEFHAVLRHDPLGVREVVGGRGRFGGLAVAAQVRADHRVTRGEQRRDHVPRRVSTRMTVQQHHRRARAAVPHPQRDLPKLDPVKPEPVKHPVHVPSTFDVTGSAFRR